MFKEKPIQQLHLDKDYPTDAEGNKRGMPFPNHAQDQKPVSSETNEVSRSHITELGLNKNENRYMGSDTVTQLSIDSKIPPYEPGAREQVEEKILSAAQYVVKKFGKYFNDSREELISLGIAGTIAKGGTADDVKKIKDAVKPLEDKKKILINNAIKELDELTGSKIEIPEEASRVVNLSFALGDRVAYKGEQGWEVIAHEDGSDNIVIAKLDKDRKVKRYAMVKTEALGPLSDEEKQRQSQEREVARMTKYAEQAFSRIMAIVDRDNPKDPETFLNLKDSGNSNIFQRPDLATLSGKIIDSVFFDVFSNLPKPESDAKVPKINDTQIDAWHEISGSSRLPSFNLFLSTKLVINYLKALRGVALEKARFEKNTIEKIKYQDYGRAYQMEIMRVDKILARS